MSPCKCGLPATEHLSYVSQGYTLIQFDFCRACWDRTVKVLNYLGRATT